MNWEQSIILIGGGGHARVVIDVLLLAGFSIKGFVDRNPAIRTLRGYPRLGDIDALDECNPTEVVLANGFGSVGVPDIRRTAYEKCRSQGFRFVSVIHPSAVISEETTLGEGVQIMAGAVVQPGAIVGENTIVNTRASVDHDCRLGAHVHVAPGATLCGDVRVGDQSHIGAGAVVIQGVSIGSRCVVGAGSVVTATVTDGMTVVGTPAKSKAL